MAGDCYEAAVTYMLDNRDDNPHLRIVHGEVAGQGPLEGATYGHAWIEDGDTVIDTSNGRNIVMPKFLYYLIGRIDQLNNTHTYDNEQMVYKVCRTGVYGPWDLKGKHPTFIQGPIWEDCEEDEEDF